MRSPIGTLVTITAGGRRQFRDIAAGDSYMSTHDPRPHFGLGDAAIVDEVDVRWPDGSHIRAHAGQAAPVPDDHARNVREDIFINFPRCWGLDPSHYYSVGPYSQNREKNLPIRLSGVA